MLILEYLADNIFFIFRSAATGKLRLVDDKLMQQKAQLLLDEAASWSLLWYLYGKGKHFCFRSMNYIVHLIIFLFVVS
jgi:hypothetical protein